MKKRWNKFLALACAFAITLTSSVTAFASEVSPIDTPSSLSTVEQSATESTNTFDVLYKDDALSRSTWIGNAGSSSLDYMESNRSFAWHINVTPVSAAYLTFVGQVDIYTTSTNAYKGTIYLSGGGFGTASGVESLNGISLRSGTHYTAKYSGTATNVLGQVFTVVDGASIGFTYR